MGVIVCSRGCCPGCQDCYGMSLGCHQDPCRCDRPCACRYEAEEDEPTRWRDGCDRHDDSTDLRRPGTYEPEPPDEIEMADLAMGPCPECGQHGACAYDDQGRALIHTTPKDDE